MKVAIQIFLLVLALLWAHLAGAAYLKAKSSPKDRYAAIIRTILSMIAAAMVLII